MKKISTTKKIILLGVALFIVVFALTVNRSQPTETKEDKKVTFDCPDGKTINAIFHLPKDESIDINLSDGRKMNLKHTLAASGARYSNVDESLVFWNKGDTAFIEENGKTTYDNCVDKTTKNPTENSTAIANPASVNCEKVGGQLSIKKREDGGEYGLCSFDEGRACEEWALMRGDCPVGGVKTTGFDTEAQKFCVWVGGKTTAVTDAVCTFKSGKICKLDELYQGKCQP